jgi:hypothetical protein
MTPEPAAAPAPAPPRDGLDAAARLVARLDEVLAPIRRQDIDRLRGEVDALIRQLEALEEGLAALAVVRRALAPAGRSPVARDQP